MKEDSVSTTKACKGFDQEGRNTTAPQFVTVIAFETDFAIPKDLKAEVLEGLLCCHVTIDPESKTSHLFTLWRTEADYKAQIHRFRRCLRPSERKVPILWSGLESEYWQPERKKSFQDRVLSWSFVVSAAAVFGVLQTLANYYQSFTDWTCARPRIEVVDSGKPLEVLENESTPFRLTFKNSSFGGRTKFEISNVYVSKLGPPKDEDDQLNTPITFSRPAIYRNLEPEAIIEVPIETPSLSSGTYRIMVEGSQENGLIWSLVGSGKWNAEVRRLQVYPLVSTGEPSFVKKTSSGALVAIQYIPGVSCDGLEGSVFLHHNSVAISGIIGNIATYSSMTFREDSPGNSGISWLSNPLDARTPLSLYLRLTGPEDTNWMEAMAKIQFFEPKIIRTEKTNAN